MSMTFDERGVHPVRENFNYHVLIPTLQAGEGSGIYIKVECKGADKDDCLCRSNYCELEDQIKMVGWPDVIKSAGDIELARLSARMDWSDPEEPWVEVEP